MTDEVPSSGQIAERKESARGKTLTGRTVSGAMWTSAGAGTEYVLHGVIFVILARLLSPEDFGIYALATVVVGLGRVFGDVGLGPSLVQRRELEKAHIRTAFTTTLILSFAIAILVAGLAPLLANLLGNRNVTPVIRVLSLLFLLRGLGVVASFLLQRHLRLSNLAKAKLVSYVAGYGVVGIILAISGLGYWALVWAALCEAAIQTVQVILLSPHSKRPQIQWRALKDLLSFGIGSSVGRLANYMAMKGDYLVVGRFLGVGPLGIYSRAYELMAMPVGLYQVVANRAFFSAVAIVQDDKERLSRAHCRTSAVTALLLLPASIALCILAPELIDVILGSRWASVVAPFQVLAVGMFFRSGYVMSEAVAKGTGRVHALALRQGIYAVLVVAGAWCGHFFGVTGVAAGVFVAMVVHFVMVTQLGLKASELSLRQFASSYVPAILVGTVVFISVFTPTIVLRTMGSPSWLTLLVSVTCGLTAVVSAVLSMPRIIGPHGTWALGYLGQIRNARKTLPLDGPMPDLQSKESDIEAASRRPEVSTPA